MRQKQDALVITFRTTTQAMAVERFCTEKGLPGRIIPVPREITAGCGLAWKAKPQDQEDLTRAFTQSGMEWEAMYIILI